MPEAIDKVSVQITINGQSYRRDVEPRLLLVQLIREELGLTGESTGDEETKSSGDNDDSPPKERTMR